MYFEYFLVSAELFQNEGRLNLFTCIFKYGIAFGKLYLVYGYDWKQMW